MPEFWEKHDLKNSLYFIPKYKLKFNVNDEN